MSMEQIIVELKLWYLTTEIERVEAKTKFLRKFELNRTAQQVADMYSAETEVLKERLDKVLEEGRDVYERAFR